MSDPFIVTAFTEHLDGIKENVEREVARVVGEFDFAEHVRQCARDTLRRAVEDATKQAIDGAMRDARPALQSAIASALTRSINCPDPEACEWNRRQNGVALHRECDPDGGV